jgi:FdhE protein
VLNAVPLTLGGAAWSVDMTMAVAALDSWDRRVRRAEDLADRANPSASLLHFYARLLRAQRTMFESFTSSAPVLAGTLDRDLARICAAAVLLVQEVAAHGPQPLREDAHVMIEQGNAPLAEALVSYWNDRSDRQFFAKAILQPYAASLVETARPITRGSLERADNRCPTCGGAPQLSILAATSPDAVDGSNRSLLCATCLTSWPFRRVVCPSCGEQDEHKLGYFHSPDLDHLRVDACDTCRRYLKNVDLGKSGLAVPLVDEVAGATLDLWARDHDYDKIELNLVGL